MKPYHPEEEQATPEVNFFHVYAEVFKAREMGKDVESPQIMYTNYLKNMPTMIPCEFPNSSLVYQRRRRSGLDFEGSHCDYVDLISKFFGGKIAAYEDVFEQLLIIHRNVLHFKDRECPKDLLMNCGAIIIEAERHSCNEDDTLHLAQTCSLCGTAFTPRSLHSRTEYFLANVKLVVSGGKIKCLSPLCFSKILHFNVLDRAVRMCLNMNPEALKDKEKRALLTGIEFLHRGLLYLSMRKFHDSLDTIESDVLQNLYNILGFKFSFEKYQLTKEGK